jgi:hypothetical protein
LLAFFLSVIVDVRRTVHGVEIVISIHNSSGKVVKQLSWFMVTKHLCRFLDADFIIIIVVLIVITVVLIVGFAFPSRIAVVIQRISVLNDIHLILDVLHVFRANFIVVLAEIVIFIEIVIVVILAHDDFDDARVTVQTLDSAYTFELIIVIADVFFSVG